MPVPPPPPLQKPKKKNKVNPKSPPTTIGNRPVSEEAILRYCILDEHKIDIVKAAQTYIVANTTRIEAGIRKNLFQQLEKEMQTLRQQRELELNLFISKRKRELMQVFSFVSTYILN